MNKAPLCPNCRRPLQKIWGMGLVCPPCIAGFGRPPEAPAPRPCFRCQAPTERRGSMAYCSACGAQEPWRELERPVEVGIPTDRRDRSFFEWLPWQKK